MAPRRAPQFNFTRAASSAGPAREKQIPINKPSARECRQMSVAQVAQRPKLSSSALLGHLCRMIIQSLGFPSVVSTRNPKEYQARKRADVKKNPYIGADNGE